MEKQYSSEIKTASAILLLSVARADENIDPDEIQTARDILEDFFKISAGESQKIVDEAMESLRNSSGLFEPGRILNEEFSREEKLDFIYCIFEEGYSDGDLHYMENYVIRQIANILHIEEDDLKDARIEVKKWNHDQAEKGS